MLLRVGVGVLGLVLATGCKERHAAPAAAPSASVASASTQGPLERGKVREFAAACEAETRARAAELVEAVRADARFSVAGRSVDADAGAFLCLAGGTKEEAVAAALDALAQNHHALVKAGMQSKLEQLLAFRLTEPSTLVRARTIQAAGAAIRGRNGSALLRGQLAALLDTEADPQLVQEVLVALRLARFDAPAPQLVARLLAIAAEGPVQNKAAALQALAPLAKHAAADELIAKVSPFTAEPQPMLRASALLALAPLADEPQAFSLLLSGASDTEPCVQAVAARALGQSAQLSAVHVLRLLLDDAAAVSCELEGFGAADRSDGRLLIDGLEAQVRLAALLAIEGLAATAPDFPAQEKNLSPAAIARNIGLVTAWYARKKATLPAPPATPQAAVTATGR
jgi:hypothetical protein